VQIQTHQYTKYTKHSYNGKKRSNQERLCLNRKGNLTKRKNPCLASQASRRERPSLPQSVSLSFSLSFSLSLIPLILSHSLALCSFCPFLPFVASFLSVKKSMKGHKPNGGQDSNTEQEKEQASGVATSCGRTASAFAMDVAPLTPIPLLLKSMLCKVLFS